MSLLTFWCHLKIWVEVWFWGFDCPRRELMSLTPLWIRFFSNQVSKTYLSWISCSKDLRRSYDVVVCGTIIDKFHANSEVIFLLTFLDDLDQSISLLIYVMFCTKKVALKRFYFSSIYVWSVKNLYEFILERLNVDSQNEIVGSFTLFPNFVWSIWGG